LTGLPETNAAFLALAFAFIAGALPLLYRVAKGPTLPDKVLAGDAFAVMAVCALALLSAAYGRAVYMDVAVSVAVLSFITAIAVAKMVEAGKL
jgi:multicomponent Na+:H+ antiporter subunit F